MTDQQRKWCWWLSALVLLGVFATFADRQHRLVNQFSVNVMDGDQWDFYNQPFDRRESLWEQFDHQHGPHREGLPCLLMHKMADWSGWNSRVDSFAISYILMAAAGCGLGLAYLCGVREPLALLPIPILYMTRGQWEDFVCSSNMSHGSAPILMFTIYCSCLFIKSDPVRLLSICILNFFLTFTGFGVFVGVVTPMILLIELAQSIWGKRWLSTAYVTIALLLVGASWWAFSYNYRFAPAVAGFKFPWDRPIEYFYFMAMMLANFFGDRGKGSWFDLTLGGLVLAILVAQCAWYGWQMLWRGVLADRRGLVIFCLASFTIIYCFDTAVGRVCLDWRLQSTASRYVTLMIPAGVSIYLQLATLKVRPLAIGLVMVYTLLILHGALYMDHDARVFARYYRQGRVDWRRVYLATHDVETANKRSGFQVYPSADAIKPQLKFFEEHHFNLFEK